MRRTYGLVFFAFALALWGTTATASAQATRTWVSGVGDDANPCSRTAPCKTWAGAISKTAPGGEMDALDPGGFGAVTITKAITLDGGGGQVASVLVAGTFGINIQAGANDQVTIRNMAINGVNQSSTPGTQGINFVSGLVLNVEHCVVQNFANYGIQFAPSTRAYLNVTDSTFENNTQGGIIASTTAAGFLNHVSIADSSFLNSQTGFGVEAGANTGIEIQHGFVAGNIGGGVIANGTSATLFMQDGAVVNNKAVGVQATNSGIVRLNRTAVTENTTGLQALGGGQVISFGSNQVSGNLTDGTPSSTVSNI